MQYFVNLVLFVKILFFDCPHIFLSLQLMVHLVTGRHGRCVPLPVKAGLQIGHVNVIIQSPNGVAKIVLEITPTWNYVMNNHVQVCGGIILMLF